MHQIGMSEPAVDPRTVAGPPDPGGKRRGQRQGFSPDAGSRAIAPRQGVTNKIEIALSSQAAPPALNDTCHTGTNSEQRGDIHGD